MEKLLLFALPENLRIFRKCFFTEGGVPGSNTFYLQYLLRAWSFREAAFLFAAPAMAGAAELLPSTAARRLPLRGSWHGASRDRGSFLTFFQISEIYA